MGWAKLSRSINEPVVATRPQRGIADVQDHRLAGVGQYCPAFPVDRAWLPRPWDTLKLRMGDTYFINSTKPRISSDGPPLPRPQTSLAPSTSSEPAICWVQSTLDPGRPGNFCRSGASGGTFLAISVSQARCWSGLWGHFTDPSGMVPGASGDECVDRANRAGSAHPHRRR